MKLEIYNTIGIIIT